MRSVALMLLLAACATQRSGGPGVATSDPGAVAVMTAVALTSSAVSRANGGCVADCSYGTVCNRATGYCDRLPCRGLCTAEQECDVRGPIETCAPRRAPELKIVTDASAPLTPR